MDAARTALRPGREGILDSLPAFKKELPARHEEVEHAEERGSNSPF
jgi:glutamate synthase (NADPH/NADH) small chain